MADTSLTFNILAENDASSTLRRVANQVDRIDSTAARTTGTLSRVATSFAQVGARGKAMGAVASAAMAGLPVLAQVAGAGIVAGLGGGLATVGIAAAAQNQKVRQEFTATKNHITQILQQIATPFESTLTGIAAQARRTFTDLAPALQDAFKTMAPAIEDVGTQLLKAFASPQVKTAIREIATSFTELVNAIGPKLPGLVKDVAGNLTRLAKTVAENKGSFMFLAQAALGLGRAFMSVVRVFSMLPPSVVIGLAAGFGVLAAALGVAAVAALGVTLPMTGIAAAVAIVVAAVAALAVAIIRNWNRIRSFTVAAWSVITGAITTAWNAVTSATSAAWDWIVQTVIGGITSVVGWFSRLPDRIGSALGDVTGWLYSTGRDIVSGMWDGLMSMGSWLTSSLWSWVRDVIPGPIEKALGISSPSKLMAEKGREIGSGLAEGMDKSSRDVQAASERMAMAAAVKRGMTDDAATAAAGGVTAGGRGGARRGGAAAARGTQTVRIEVAGPEEMKKLLRSIVRKDGRGDVQTAFGQ